MVSDPITRYHLRWNFTLGRKEWRRVGQPTLVVGGGTITPPSALAVTLAASPADPVPVGGTVTLTANPTGGTAPYVLKWSQDSGPAVTLAGSGLTRTFTATAASGSRVFRVNVTDDELNVQEATVSVQTVGSVAGAPLFAGHIPNRVIVGYAAGNPDWDTSKVIIQNASQARLGYPGVGAYEWRRFTGTGTSGWDIAELRKMLADGDSVNVYNWISTKVVNNDWAGVANGNYPAIPAMWNQLANERRAAGKSPFMATMHHEPRGDGDLNAWAAMHVYMSNAVAANNDIMAWSTIGNGFLWSNPNPTASIAADRNATYPQLLIDTLRINKHLLGVDTYDSPPVVYTGQTTAPPRVGVSCSVRLRNFIDYMRARNCGALGIGEWSTLDGPEMIKTWEVQRDNRDLLAVSNYYNSIIASVWDWRLIPDSYPDNNINAVDYGGTPLTQARLNYFPTILAESVSAQYTGPL